MTQEEMRARLEALKPEDTALVLTTDDGGEEFDLLSRFDPVTTAKVLLRVVDHVLGRLDEPKSGE